MILKLDIFEIWQNLKFNNFEIWQNWKFVNFEFDKCKILKLANIQSLKILKFDMCHTFKLGQNLKIWQYWNLTNVKFDNFEIWWY
jgi:hypothetical protein